MIHNKLLEKLVIETRNKKIELTNSILDNILTQISVQKKYIIISNCINKMSLDLIYDGAMPKEHFITLRTEKEGILGGYILISNKPNVPSKIINNKIGNTEIFYKFSNGIQIETDYNNNYNYLQAYINPFTEQFITSDLDILMICGKGDLSMDRVDHFYGMGDILKYEYDVCLLINQSFTESLRKLNSFLPPSLISLISHGPFNRYSKSKLEDIYFPLTIYHPIIGKFNLGSEEKRKESIKEFFNICFLFQEQGYKIDIHRNWKSIYKNKLFIP